MKRLFIFLVIIPIFFGCEKEQLFEKSGIYVNGQLECELKSAFAGGGMADPSEGHSSRMHIYENYYSAGPSWTEVKEKVGIYGFYHNGKEYSSAGEGSGQIEDSKISIKITLKDKQTIAAGCAHAILEKRPLRPLLWHYLIFVRT